MQANRMTHVILHEMLEGRPMLSPTLRGPHKGPPLEQLELELKKYIRQLTSIHKLIFYQEKDRVPEPEEKPPREVEPDNNNTFYLLSAFRDLKVALHNTVKYIHI